MSAEADRAPLPAYRLLLGALAPALVGYTLWQALRARSWRYLRERCGRPAPGGEVAPIWLHAASVGELHAALPLIEILGARHGAQALLITTSTPSSARRAAQILPEGARHAFLPLDFPRAVRRFLRRLRPRCALIVETELWPNLFAACTARGIPPVIINGRLSARTLTAPRWLRRQYARSLALCGAILARNEADKNAFLSLGAAPSRVQVAGNLKFSARPKSAAPPALGRPYVLAASTREGEERLIWRAWERTAGDGRLLVIAPRHPARLRTILKDLNLPAEQIAIRSRAQTVNAATRIYLADTFGELADFIAGAELVFMGGSLAPRGGQNVLEAAQQGKATIFGPHMENFAEEARLLLAHAAAIQLADAGVDALADAFGALLADPGRCAAMGAAAQALIADQGGVAIRYAQALEPWCKEPA